MTPSKMRRLYLREAALTLISAIVILRVLPPRHIFAWVNRPPRRVNRFAAADADRISWAIDTVAARRWIKAACLPCALAAYHMLRRRGIPSRLCLGIAQDGESITAHAWIEVGNKKVVGGMAADRFTPIAEFGAGP